MKSSRPGDSLMPCKIIFRIFLILAILTATPLFADLEQYVSKPEPDFSWSLRDKIPIQQTGDLVYDFHFVSQKWQGIKWEHQLQVYEPRDSRGRARIMLMWLTGGSATPA